MPDPNQEPELPLDISSDALRDLFESTCPRHTYVPIVLVTACDLSRLHLLVHPTMLMALVTELGVSSSALLEALDKAAHRSLQDPTVPSAFDLAIQLAQIAQPAQREQQGGLGHAPKRYH